MKKVKLPTLEFETKRETSGVLTDQCWHEVFDGLPVMIHPHDLWSRQEHHGVGTDPIITKYKVRRVFVRKKDAFLITILHRGESTALDDACYQRPVWGEMIVYIFSSTPGVLETDTIGHKVQKQISIGSSYIGCGDGFNSPCLIATAATKMSDEIWDIDLKRTPSWFDTGERRKVTPHDYWRHLELGHNMEVMIKGEYLQRYKDYHKQKSEAGSSPASVVQP